MLQHIKVHIEYEISQIYYSNPEMLTRFIAATALSALHYKRKHLSRDVLKRKIPTGNPVEGRRCSHHHMTRTPVLN